MTHATNQLAPREFSAALAGLGKLLIAFQNPNGLPVTIENLVAQIDPALAPEIMLAQVALPIIGAVLEQLGTQSGVPAPRWMGAPRAI